MAKFITRIELYGNPGDEVIKLAHAAMELAKFKNQVVLSGILYCMPKAEYIWEGTGTINTIEALAVQAVMPIWKDFGVMTIKTESRIGFVNLKPAEK